MGVPVRRMPSAVRHLSGVGKRRIATALAVLFVNRNDRFVTRNSRRPNFHRESDPSADDESGSGAAY